MGKGGSVVGLSVVGRVGVLMLLISSMWVYSGLCGISSFFSRVWLMM